MRNVLCTCFFTFAMLLHSIESAPSRRAEFARIINRLKHASSNVPEGIAYFQKYFYCQLIDVRLESEFTRSHKVVRNGLVIGLNVDDTIVPIFDHSQKMIVVRGNKNILLRPEETWIFPYYRPVNTDPDYPNHEPSSTILADMINRYRQAPSLHTGGIAFYQKHFNGPLINVVNNWTFSDEHKFVRNGFIIGLNLDDRLVPIFDVTREIIVIRGTENIKLLPEDAGLLPYHHPID